MNERVELIDARAQELFSMSLEEINFRNKVVFYADDLRYIVKNKTYPEGIASKQNRISLRKNGVVECYNAGKRGMLIRVTDAALAVLRELEKKEDKVSN